MSTRLNKPVTFGAALVLGLLVTAPLYADAVMMHFALASSMPEAGATVTRVEAIRLTFTQEARAEGLLIRLLDPEGKAVKLGAIRLNEARVMSASVESDGLRSGRYTVSWRGAGDDGHFVKGEYAFTLQAEDGSR